MCAGLGAVDPAKGLSFLTALLSSSSRSLAQHSPFLSSHFVYSPFVFARFLSVRGRHSSFFDSFQIETSTVALASITASEAAVAASSRGTVMPGLNEQLQEPGNVPIILSRLVKDILGQRVSPTQPLMEVRGPALILADNICHLPLQ